MAGAAAVLSALGGAATSIWDRAYTYWRDQIADNRADRDFDYQKALQNQIFQREDNAVQRRMADLQAAGLNPNLAAGSAAGAGAVVGRSNTPTSNFHSGSGNPVGTALDMAQHVAQLRAQRTEQKILNHNERKARAEADMAESNSTYTNLSNVYDELALLYQLGITSDTKLKVRNGRFGIYNNGYEDGDYLISDTPLQNQLEWQWRNNKNAADLLQKDVDWYTADKIGEMFGAAARSAAGFGGAYYNFSRRR